MAAADILRHHKDADRAAIREHLSGNYCRCTGYQAIVDAVADTLEARSHSGASDSDLRAVPSLQSAEAR
jgi:carbon-monoxide dehydrogenase small subunit